MSFRVNEIEQILAKYVESQGGVAVVAWDEGNTVVYCNKAFSGLMQSEAELYGKTIFQFLRFPEYPGFDFGTLDGSLKTSVCLKTGPTDYRCDSVIFQLNRGYIAFCDRPVILQSDIVEKMAKMNLELTNLTWESQKKNRTIERINAQLKQEIAERQRTEEKLTAKVNYAMWAQGFPSFIVTAEKLKHRGCLSECGLRRNLRLAWFRCRRVTFCIF